MFWVSIPSTYIMEQHRNITREKHKLTDTWKNITYKDNMEISQRHAKN